MAKKTKENAINEVKGPYICPGCHTKYAMMPPCPLCHRPMEVGIYPDQMTEINEFLKKNPLNKVELYLFGDLLCYTFVPYEKPKGNAKDI